MTLNVSSVRFMGRTDLQLLDAHWDPEPFLQKLLIHNETIFRFMEALDLLMHANWNLELLCSHANGVAGNQRRASPP